MNAAQQYGLIAEQDFTAQNFEHAISSILNASVIRGIIVQSQLYYQAGAL